MLGAPGKASAAGSFRRCYGSAPARISTDWGRAATTLNFNSQFSWWVYAVFHMLALLVSGAQIYTRSISYDISFHGPKAPGAEPPHMRVLAMHV